MIDVGTTGQQSLDFFFVTGIHGFGKWVAGLDCQGNSWCRKNYRKYNDRQQKRRDNITKFISKRLQHIIFLFQS